MNSISELTMRLSKLIDENALLETQINEAARNSFTRYKISLSKSKLRRKKCQLHKH